MKALLALLAVAVGMVLPAQAGINAELRRHLGQPLLAAVVNFSVGLVLLVLVVAAMRLPLPSAAELREAPVWAWLGGFCGAALVLTSLIAAPRLGAVLLVGCLLAGQLSASVLLDHFGWLGYPVRPANLGRIAGVLLLVAGVVLIQRSS